MNKVNFAIAIAIVFLLLGSMIACVLPTTTPTPIPTSTEEPGATPAATVEATATPTRAPTPAVSPTPTLAPTATPTPRQPLGALPSIADVVDLVKPAVVSIVVETVTYNFFLQPVPQQGAGSGAIFDQRGYIVTNNHVVENARQIKVSLTDGRTFDASLVGRDPLSDLAVVKIEADNLPTVRLGGSQPLRVGDWVIAIGNALALPGGPTVTIGVVSNLGRSIQEPNGATLNDMIQTDAAINPGNSGGPLVNLAGEVIGINTAIASEAQGIGFAIDVKAAMPVIQQLIERGGVIRPWLGVQSITVTPAVVSQYRLSVTEGVLLASVVKDSPADKAGLKQGDVIIKLAGEKVTTSEQLRQIIQSKKIGDNIEVVFIRGSREQTVTVALGESPPISG